MPRHFQDWLPAYVRYASVTEAPRRMHFWAGVSTIAAALRRRVWIDMKRYTWYPNFYIIFVAPPGVVSKSTTAGIAEDLLRNIPGIKFGPDIVTWPALVEAFAASSEEFLYGEEFIPMSAMTLIASELGNLIDPADRQMINLYIDLWDGRKVLDKRTKGSGCDLVAAPWINMLGCTTPNWIVDNLPRAAVGGGFTSRCIFVYAKEKERYIPFVDEVVGDDDAALRQALLEDLEYISTALMGPFIISPEARAWERVRYEKFWRSAALQMDSQTLEGYAARKQTMLFKTAMVLSVSRSDSMVIEEDDLQLAERMLTDLESDLDKIFSGIGRTTESLQAERFIEFVRKRGEVSYEEAYKQVHIYFPDHRTFEGVVAGAIRSGQLILENRAGGFWWKVGPGLKAAEGGIGLDTEFKG